MQGPAVVFIGFHRWEPQLRGFTASPDPAGGIFEMAIVPSRPPSDRHLARKAGCSRLGASAPH